MRTRTGIGTSMRYVVTAAAFFLCTSLTAVAGQLEDAITEYCNTQPCPESLVIGVRTYVYGYPLLMVDVTKDVATNVKNATTATGRAPINQFSHNGLPDESYKDVVLPSVSTPYSNAFLDLGKEPIVLRIPEVGELCQTDGGPPCVPRFFLMQVIDGWTNVGGLDPACITVGAATPPPGFCGLGSRYYTGPGDYAFVGPDWNRPLPPGIKQVIRLQTNLGWIAGRHLTNGSAQDLAEIQAIQQQYALIPLKHYGKGKPYRPPAHSHVDRRIDMQTDPRTQVANMDAGTYYRKFAELMGPNPPSPDDAAIVAEMAKIGLVPGQPFQIKKLDKGTQQALEDAAVIGQALIAKTSKEVQLTTTNWSMALDLGAWDTKYLERAAIAYGGLGANLYLDAVYAGAIYDQDKDELFGDYNYQLRFEAGQYPPVNALAFWSVTLYSRPSETLYDNSIGRNGLGIPAVQDHLPCTNGDGSLVFHIQHEAPTDPDALCNWLPAPAAGTKFLLLLRMYWPTDALFDGGWIPPAVTKQ